MNMDDQSHSSDNQVLLLDELHKQTTGSTAVKTIGALSPLSSSTVPRTARDKFFKDLNYEKENTKWSAQCSLCEKPKRVVDNVGVTSNFTRHAREHHKEQYQQWLIDLGTCGSSKPTTKITDHFSTKTFSSSIHSYGSHHPRQVELSKGIVNNLIIKLGLPMSLVERPAFVNFMKTVDPKFTMTSRRTLSRTTIPHLYKKMNDNLKSFCAEAKFLSLTLDVWTDRRMRSFFSVTGHSILDGHFKSYVLCFIPLWGSHSGLSLLQKYEDVINSFGIQDKIVRLVTDSASNNLSAFQNLTVPGFEDYFVHNDGDEKSDDEDSDVDLDAGMVSDEYDEPSDVTAATTVATAEINQDDVLRFFFDTLIANNEAYRLPCFSHTLQLVVKDGLAAAKCIQNSLAKVAKIAKLSHTSTKFAEKLETMKKTIPRANITRWNSQFNTVEHVLAIPPTELNEILLQLKYNHLCLNSRDLAMLNEFIALLSLFAEATTVTQTQNAPSISFVAPSILAIYFDLKNEKNNVQYTSTVCDALLSSLLSRLGGLLEQLEVDLSDDIDFKVNEKFYDLYKDPVFLISSFLDGKFKLRWITESFLPDLTQQRVCNKIQKLIIDYCVIMEHANINKSTSFVDANSVQQQPPLILSQARV